MPRSSHNLAVRETSPVKEDLENSKLALEGQRIARRALVKIGTKKAWAAVLHVSAERVRQFIKGEPIDPDKVKIIIGDGKLQIVDEYHEMEDEMDRWLHATYGPAADRGRF